MWNYRVVRKRNTWIDPEDKKERVGYSYAIYEAYYDKNARVGAITQEPVEPFGENMEELRHAWVMMAEAFGQPILDYDIIPEHAYDNQEDPQGSVPDERFGEGGTREVPLEDLEKEMEAKWGPFDREEYTRRVEEHRVENERVHGELFVGPASLKELIEKIYSDYMKSVEKDKDENPLKRNQS
jgi:hypothetical protein